MQKTHALALAIIAPDARSTSLILGGDKLVAVGGKVTLLSISLVTAFFFLVHHIYAFTIHVTVLILLKVFFCS